MLRDPIIYLYYNCVDVLYDCNTIIAVIVDKSYYMVTFSLDVWTPHCMDTSFTSDICYDHCVDVDYAA